MKIGVIGMQGAVSEHLHAIKKLGKVPVWVKGIGELAQVSAVIIPGGESTTISKLMAKAGLLDGVAKRAKEGMPVYGTCAGMILLAKKGDGQVKQTGQQLLGLMDAEISRNAFGRQRESFEKTLDVGGIRDFPCVFIRAPAIKRVWGKCRVLAEFEGLIVAAEQGHLLATAFHPELTEDLRLHEHFFSKI
jgi:5'-phosphate synthase pdxT subunit